MYLQSSLTLIHMRYLWGFKHGVIYSLSKILKNGPEVLKLSREVENTVNYKKMVLKYQKRQNVSDVSTFLSKSFNFVNFSAYLAFKKNQYLLNQLSSKCGLTTKIKIPYRIDSVYAQFNHLYTFQLSIAGIIAK